MKSSKDRKKVYQEYFHKICVMGGGLTGAIMVLLLKQSKLFKKNEIAWIKPKEKKHADFRTTFYNSASIELLKNLHLIDNLDFDDYSTVNQIEVFGAKRSSPLIWNNSSSNNPLGIVVKNEIILDALDKLLNDIPNYDGTVTNTDINEYERTLYIDNKKSIKTHLVLSADGKSSYMRKLLSIKTIEKNTKHIAVSGFLKQSKKHCSKAIQAFTELGPIGILPFENDNIINFVQSIEKNKLNSIMSQKEPEKYLCQNLSDFFSHTGLSFMPLNKIKNTENKLSVWDLDLNLVVNPTAKRTILIGDAAHSIHPLAGQGFNLALRDCLSVIKAINNSVKFGNDLGDKAVLEFYKSDRLPHTLSMTAFTDFLFYGFTSNSANTKSFLSKGMENLNKSKLKDIFKIFAST
jgi:2-octaprenyl-6-methoxyphenol hydroxylase